MERAAGTPSRHVLACRMGGALLLVAAVASAQVTGPSAFERIKQLEGEWQVDWEGREYGGTDQPLRVRFQVTTGGTVVRETSRPGTPEEMNTFYHLDGDDLLVTHHCLFGNQPTMALEPSLSTPESLQFALRGVTSLMADCPFMTLDSLELLGPGALRAHWATHNEAGGVIDTHEVVLRKVGGGPPVCRIAFVTNGVDATVTAANGLASIVVTRQQNATVNAPGFPPGSPGPVVVTARKVTPGVRSVVELKITDVLGLVTLCDPVLTLQVRETGKPVSDTVSNLPQEESQVTVRNGTPGISSLKISVNGTKYTLNGLAPGEQRTLDVSAAMLPGDDNFVTLTAHGKPGGSAEVILHDRRDAARR